MTADEKAKITHMRLEGVGFVKISTDLGISVNTIKSYCRRKALPGGGIGYIPAETEKQNTTRCKQCGKPLTQNPKRKVKRFCSDTCRLKWWNTHREAVNMKTASQITCADCGKEFSCYSRENRKYCCHSCYITNRFGGEDACDNRTV